MSALAEPLEAAPPCRDFSADLIDGLNVLPDFREGREQALSEYAACLAPLLSAMGWMGRARHVAEAVPHFSRNLDLEGLRRTVANLNICSLPIRIRDDRISPSLFPCLFVPKKGGVRVIIARDQDGLRVYDGSTRTYQTLSGSRLWGTAYVFRGDPEAQNRGGTQGAWTTGIARRFARLFLQVIAATFMLNILGIAMPLFMMAIYDKVIPSRNPYELVYLVGGVAFAMATERGFRRVRNRIMTYLAGRIDFIVGTSIFRQVLLMPVSMTENEPLGSQLTHLQEFESIREFFTGPLGETLIDLPFVILFVAVIASIGGWLVLVPITAALAMFIAGLASIPIARLVLSVGSHSRGQQQRFLIEAVTGMRSIRFSGSESIWLNRFRDLSAATASSDFRSSMFTHTLQTVGRIVTLISGIGLVWFGAGMAMQKELTIGALVALMSLSWRVLTPFQSGLMLLNRGAQIRGSLRQINHLLRLKPERNPGRVPLPRVFRGRISFSGVSYRHSPDSDPALTGVTFQIGPGELVAITGPNGAGKSTLAKLACGLYQAPVGSVTIDGIDVRQLDPLDIRQHIGFVPQTSELMYGTVAQNFRLAVPTALDQEIVEAARLADVHEAILRLPEGYSTRLNAAMMAELPEGFKQKLSIARALLRNPSILIFDEPGQMLDESGDRALIATLQRLRGRSTVIVVTHRPSHMRVADRLIVLNLGRIQFNGPPAEALAKLEGST